MIKAADEQTTTNQECSNNYQATKQGAVTFFTSRLTLENAHRSVNLFLGLASWYLLHQTPAYSLEFAALSLNTICRFFEVCEPKMYNRQTAWMNTFASGISYFSADTPNMLLNAGYAIKRFYQAEQEELEGYKQTNNIMV